MEKVLKSKPFDALCKAAEVGLGLPNAKQKARDELAELLSKAMLANLAGGVENWICVLGEAVAEIVHGMVFDGPQVLSSKVESERYVAEAVSAVFWLLNIALVCYSALSTFTLLCGTSSLWNIV